MWDFWWTILRKISNRLDQQPLGSGAQPLLIFFFKSYDLKHTYWDFSPVFAGILAWAHDQRSRPGQTPPLSTRCKEQLFNNKIPRRLGLAGDSSNPNAASIPTTLAHMKTWVGHCSANKLCLVGFFQSWLKNSISHSTTGNWLRLKIPIFLWTEFSMDQFPNLISCNGPTDRLLQWCNCGEQPT